MQEEGTACRLVKGFNCTVEERNGKDMPHLYHTQESDGRQEKYKVGGDALCHHYQPSLAYFVSGQTAEQVKSKSGNTVGQSHPSQVPDRIGESKN